MHIRTCHREPGPGQRIRGVERQGALEGGDCIQGRGGGDPRELGPAPQEERVGLHVLRIASVEPPFFGRVDPDLERGAHPGGDRVLQPEQIGLLEIVPAGPDRRAIGCPHQLHADPQPFTGALQRPRDDVLRLQRTAGLLRVGRALLIRENRTGRADAEPVQTRHPGDNRVGDIDAEPGVLLGLGQGAKRQDGKRNRRDRARSGHG